MVTGSIEIMFAMNHKISGHLQWIIAI